MAQEVERILGKDEVISSTLISSSKTTLRRGFFDLFCKYLLHKSHRRTRFIQAKISLLTILHLILHIFLNIIYSEKGGAEMIYKTEEIKSIITPIAIKYNIKAVFLFGSYARGTATENSDIDFIIDTTGTDLDTLFKLGSLYEELSNIFGKEIDLITVSSLEQPVVRQSEIAFRENIIKERMSLYAVA